MSSIIAASYAVWTIPSIVDIYNWIAKLWRKYKLQGLCIGIAGGKSFLVKNLKSDDTIFIDIDSAVEGNNNGKTSSFGIDINFFGKAKSYADETISILDGVSKSAKTIVFLSRDYKLLKFLNLHKINYLCGSQSYYEQCKLTVEDQKTLQEYKDKLQNNSKMSKVIVYNSREELLMYVSAIFNCQVKT